MEDVLTKSLEGPWISFFLMVNVTLLIVMLVFSPCQDLDPGPQLLNPWLKPIKLPNPPWSLDKSLLEIPPSLQSARLVAAFWLPSLQPPTLPLCWVYIYHFMPK